MERTLDVMRLSGRLVRNAEPRAAGRELLYAALEVRPAMFCWYETRRHPQRRTVDPDRTDLVIAGFRSSANSFLDALLRLANDGVVLPGRHRAGQLRAGVDHGLPVVLLVRPPEDAIASSVAREPDRRVEVEVVRYSAFHSACAPFLDRVVVATFDDVTQRPDVVIDAVNRRFGRKLNGLASLGPDGRQQVFDVIESRARRDHGDLAAVRQAAPSEARTSANQEARRSLAAPRLRRDLERAQRHYDRLAELAGRSLSCP